MARVNSKWQMDGYDLQLVGYGNGARIPWDYLAPDGIDGLNPLNSTLVAASDCPSELDFQLFVKLTGVAPGEVVQIAIKKNGTKIVAQDCATGETSRSVALSISAVPAAENDVFEAVIRVNGTPTLVGSQSALQVQAFV